MSYPNFWVLKLEWVMIYFIFLASLALVTCYLVYHWRNMTEFDFASNLLTCPLVDLSTYHVTLSFIYPVYKQLVYSSTRWLVHLPCYSVFYLPYLQATCSLVHSLTCPLTNKKTTLPCIFNKFCYICRLFNTYVSHVCWDYRYFILWV